MASARLPLLSVLAGLLALGILIWWGTGEPRSGPEPRQAPTAEGTTTPTPGGVVPSAAAAVVPDGSIPEGGRLTLALAALPADRPMQLRLELPDEFRLSGAHAVRIVSAEGDRIDTTASPRTGSGTGLDLAIDPGTLGSGIYMVEVDVGGTQHLPIRRYVIELTP